MAEICFEDFLPGEVSTYGARTVEKDEIIAFAREFDPQPFHLDEEAAKSSFVGTLIASGWQTNALINRMNCDAFLTRSACLGSPGLDAVKWLRPVKPGDTLGVRRQILSATPSRSRPDRGVVRFAYDLFNQDDQPVCHHDCLVMFARRTPGKVAPLQTTPAAKDEAGDPFPDRVQAATTGHLAFFEEIEPGTVLDLGQYAFTHENVHAFASAYDPQGFHLDPAVAARGPFGQIIASGWHTTAAWMGTMARDRAARSARTIAEGRTPARLGPSPGFRNLKFLKPVRPGDVLTYRSRLIDKRPSASRPQWGLVFHHNTATNQNGERVMEFTGSVFWECRQP